MHTLGECTCIGINAGGRSTLAAVPWPWSCEKDTKSRCGVVCCPCWRNLARDQHCNQTSKETLRLHPVRQPWLAFSLVAVIFIPRAPRDSINKSRSRRVSRAAAPPRRHLLRPRVTARLASALQSPRASLRLVACPTDARLLLSVCIFF